MIEVLLLSVLQGIAEFLPISSSGHLVLGKSLLGLGETGLRLDIALHVGTLIAVFVFYAAVLKRILMKLDWRYVLKILASSIPVGVVGVLFRETLETKLANPTAVGCALLVTGALLTATRFLPKGEKSVTFSRAMAMGVAQALAILPGVSRSGSTLIAARLTRVDASEAAEFSFLMSAPPILGAALLEIVGAAEAEALATPEVSWLLCGVGVVVSALVGYFALKFLLKSLKSDKFWLFGPYCFAVGLLALFCRG